VLNGSNDDSLTVPLIFIIVLSLVVLKLMHKGMTWLHSKPEEHVKLPSEKEDNEEQSYMSRFITAVNGNGRKPNRLYSDQRE
jgi:hypothetical protein